MSKIAIYGICKNEIKFLERCFKPVANADYIIITDTGSTDGTLEKLEQLKKQYSQLQVFQETIDPWRFDVARNIAMSHVPADADILVSIDMDDVFPKNWRQIIEEDFNKGYNKIYGLYQYYDNDGNKGDMVHLDRVSNQKAHWEHPLHESLICEEETNAIEDCRFLVEHRQDRSKNRDYFDVVENNLDPNDLYTYLCYGYELYNKGRYEECLQIFDNLYDPNNEYTTRKWVVMCAQLLVALGRKKEAIYWYERALKINRPDSMFEDGVLYQGVIEKELKEIQMENQLHKIAVYMVCYNDITTIERTLFSVSTADYLIILDTGSTDGTRDKLESLKGMLPQLQVFYENIQQNSWDDKMNRCISYIPKDADILVALKSADIYPSEWREKIEEDWKKDCNKIIIGRQVFGFNGRIINTEAAEVITSNNIIWQHGAPQIENERAYNDQAFLIMNKPPQNNSMEIQDDNLEERIANQFFYGWELLNDNQWEKGMQIFQSIYALNSKYTVRKWLVTIADWLVQQQRYNDAKIWYLHALAIHNEQSEYEDLSLYPDSVIHDRIKQTDVITHYKIAVYAICGNECDNIDPWMESMWEADYICVLDTGSTDGSYEKLLEYQNKHPEKVIISQKTYNPWRFDTPRNDSLKLVPTDADLCICTDLDERLTKTWGDKVRAVWYPGCERGYYLYAWSHLENGDPARVFWYDKIHSNSGLWQWKFPVHEALWHPNYEHVNLDRSQVCYLPDDFIMLHHYPKHKDGRSNYLPLLEMRAEEYENDFYGLIYLAHEYKYQGKYKECINFITQKVFPKMLCQPDNMNCKTDLYMFLGDCHMELDEEVEAEACFRAGIAMDPTFRDNYLRLARLKLNHEQPQEAINIINECFSKSRHQYSWLEGDSCWSWEPWDLLCLAYWSIQATDMAYQCAKLAYIEDPRNERLKGNYERLEKMVKH